MEKNPAKARQQQMSHAGKILPETMFGHKLCSVPVETVPSPKRRSMISKLLLSLARSRACKHTGQTGWNDQATQKPLI